MTRQSLRTRHAAHRLFIIGVLVIGIAAILLPWVLLVVGPRGAGDLRYWGSVGGTPLLWALSIHLVWHALVAYGALPVLTVWRSGEDVYAGSVLGRLGWGRQRLRLESSGFSVTMLDNQRRQPGVGHMFYPEISSGGESVELRTYGVITREEIHEFLVAAVVRLRQ